MDTLEPLIDALCAIAATGNAADRVESVHGEKHVVDGLLPSHTGQRPDRMVRTVWIIDRGQDAPRFVTAYPRQE